MSRFILSLSKGLSVVESGNELCYTGIRIDYLDDRCHFSDNDNGLEKHCILNPVKIYLTRQGVGLAVVPNGILYGNHIYNSWAKERKEMIVAKIPRWCFWSFVAVHLTIVVVLYLPVHLPKWRLFGHPLRYQSPGNLGWFGTNLHCWLKPAEDCPRRIFVMRMVLDRRLGKFRDGVQLYDPGKHTPKGAVPIPYKDIEKLYNTWSGVLNPISAIHRWEQKRDEYSGKGNEGQSALRQAFLRAGIAENDADRMVSAVFRDREKEYKELLNSDFRIPLGKLLAEHGWNEEQIRGFLYGSDLGPSPADRKSVV